MVIYLNETLIKHSISKAKFAEVTGLDRTTLYKQLRYGFVPREETLEVYSIALEKLVGGSRKTHLRRIRECLS